MSTDGDEEEKEEGKREAKEKVTPDIKNIECGRCGYSKRMWLFGGTHAFTYVSCGHVVCVYAFLFIYLFFFVLYFGTLYDIVVSQLCRGLWNGKGFFFLLSFSPSLFSSELGKESISQIQAILQNDV